ncbi:MAG: hypothetical protein IJ678_00395 [Kiritimatiellae bacterium]|nr:hypothetical protein [Kiritimatiellia bacterium]
MPLTAVRNTAGFICKETFGLVWKAVVRDEDGAVVTNAIDTTRGHVFYTILDEPKAPWTSEELSESNVWASVLDVACSPDWAGGCNSKTSAASGIASGIFSSGKFRYEINDGASCFIEGNNFLLSRFLRKLDSPGMADVNCTDCANATVSLSNALGCELWSSIMGFHFDTNPYCAIGRPDWTPPSWGWGFSYHEVVWEGNAGDSDLVFDACLKYNGADNPDSGVWTKMQPIGVVFSDGDAGAPYVYRERLTPPGPSGYSRCLPNPLKKHRFPVK